MTTTFLVNRSPYSGIEFKTPEEKWSGNSPDLSNMRVFGCATYVHQNERKLKPRALKCIFLGYLQGVKGYRLWVKDGRGFKTINSRDVILNEFDFPCLKVENSVEKYTSMTKFVGVQKNQIQVEPYNVDHDQVEPM